MFSMNDNGNSLLFEGFIALLFINTKSPAKVHYENTSIGGISEDKISYIEKLNLHP